jgi:hypothetical protein
MAQVIWVVADMNRLKKHKIVRKMNKLSWPPANKTVYSRNRSNWLIKESERGG